MAGYMVSMTWPNRGGLPRLGEIWPWISEFFIASPLPLPDERYSWRVLGEFSPNDVIDRRGTLPLS